MTPRNCLDLPEHRCPVDDSVVSKLVGELERIASEANPGESRALPEIGQLSRIISDSFWASLRKEEARPPVFSLAVVGPEMSGQPLVFARPIPLSVEAIVKLSPAQDAKKRSLALRQDKDKNLEIWGTASAPSFCPVFSTSGPGVTAVRFFNRTVVESGRPRSLFFATKRPRPQKPSGSWLRY
jgi:hypothetical protein